MSRSDEGKDHLKKKVERKWEYAPKSEGLVDREHVAPQTVKVRSLGSDGGGGRGHDEGLLSRFKGPMIWLAAILAIVVGLFAFSALFATATIDIEVSRQETSIDRDFTAYSGSSAGDVPFEFVVIESEVIERVPTTKEDEVSRKASGKIVVFNESPAKVDLVVNTRFKSNSGLIYRVGSPVTVPAASNASGEMLPGSLEISVLADKAGKEYNTGLTDFKIPGLEGSDLYDKMYARSKTEITGGFEGVLRTAEDAEIEAAQMRLVERAESAARSDLTGSIASDVVLYQDGIFVTVDTSVPNDVVTDESGKTFVPVRGVATLYAAVFDRHSLSAAIAAKAIPSYDGSDVLVTNLDELAMTLKDREAIDPQTSKTFTFGLKGKPFILWELDTDALRNDLVGLNESEAEAIVRSKYDESVRRYNAEFSPFWIKTFPNNANDIVITIQGG
jgi:hypothetical protein